MKEKMELNQLKEFYRTHQLQTMEIHPINYAVIQYISVLEPKTIFEFGCNQGKNLIELEECGFDNVCGIDIANIEHPKTAFGDEQTLMTYENKCVDLSFTNSVLNHIPLRTVTEILYHLKRMSNTVVLGENCQDVDNERWFNHPYEELGFKKLHEIVYKDRKYGLYTSLES